ncbi:MAG: DUF2339 domain-containing protein [Acidimicrobiia bacterium]|nr:DUF2339 domain-containing protein [Acidimicrobiia bacterium]
MTPTTLDQPPPLPGQRIEPKDDLWDSVLTGKNLFRVGLALVLLGLVFMFRYAVEAGWITAVARVGLGAAASIAMLGLGVRLVSIRKGFGVLLAGGGVAGLYMTVYAALHWYGLTSPSAAFIQLVAVSVLGVGLALRWEAEPLAVVSLTGALVAPLVVPGRMLEGSGDSFYFLAVLGAAVSILLVRQWIILFGSTFVLASAVVFGEVIRVELGFPGAAMLEVDIMLVGLVAAFLVAPMVARQLGSATDALLGWGASAVGPVVYLIAAIAHGGDNQALALAAFTLGGLHALAGSVFRGDESLAITHGLVAAGLVTAGATVLLDGPVAVLVVALVGAAITLIGFGGSLTPLRWVGGSTLALAGFLSIATMVDPGGIGDTLARLAVIGVVGLVAVALDRITEAGATVARNLAVAYVYLGSFLVGLGDLASYSQALVTAVWSVGAVGLIVFGSLADRKTVTRLGIGTMAAILVKVFLIDLATVETLWKMALFLALGVVLLMVGYWISNEE